ncbi:MAG: amidohydrolase family protein [Acidimicrobiales bacterium]
MTAIDPSSRSDRRYLDADSHIMELPNFLRDHAADNELDLVPRLSLSGGGKLADALDRLDERGGHAPERIDAMIALGSQLLSGPKGYEALGAFNAAERSQALDQLGYERQWVFATFSTEQIFSAIKDPAAQAASIAAHNRGMAAFCANDDRLIGVGAAVLDDPSHALVDLEQVIDLGLGAVWVPHRPAGQRSPGHDDLDPFWARAAEAGITILLHIGGHPLQLKTDWMNTGRDVPTDWLGGGENVQART